MNELLNNLEDLGIDTKLQFDEFMKAFWEANYFVVVNVTNSEILDFLKEPNIRRASMKSKVDLFLDYLGSNGRGETYDQVYEGYYDINGEE